MTTADRHSAMLLLCGSAMAASMTLLLAPSALLGVAILPVLGGGALLLWGSVRGLRGAIVTLVFVSVFLIDAVFRYRAYADKAVDFQVVLKIGLWALLFFVAIVHWRSWVAHVLTPANFPWLVFLAWLLFTAAVSPMPAYSAVAAFSICAYVVFCAYVFANFDRAEIFAVMVVAMVAFCLVSIALYFAVPEFGRFIYWLNEQRYVSARMAGMAGSANNMGRIAAFGLVLMILYAAEFRRIHRLLLPLGAPILALSLVMTNSRASIGMVALLWAGVQLLQWRRLYLLVLAVSLVLLAAVILLPGSEAVLMLMARNGNMDEVTSMTGRSDIWSAVARLAAERPWTGFGYASSIIVLPQHEREVGFLTSHAHNIIMQLLLTTGWIGTGLFCLSVLSVGTRAAYLGDRAVLTLLAFVVFNGITESSAFGTLANICTLAFAIAITLPPERSPYENDPAYQRGFS